MNSDARREDTEDVRKSTSKSIVNMQPRYEDEDRDAMYYTSAVKEINRGVGLARMMATGIMESGGGDGGKLC